MAAIPKEKPSRVDEARAQFARYKADETSGTTLADSSAKPRAFRAGRET